MLQPWRYEWARQEARFHLQVAVRHVQPEVKSPGDAQVEGEVVRAFRGGLLPGDRVSFPVSVLTPDTPRERIPIGGTRWTDYASLRAAKFLEVFLDGEPPAGEVALWQVEIIPTATDRPTMKGSFPAIAPVRVARGFVYRLLGRWFGAG